KDKSEIVSTFQKEYDSVSKIWLSAGDQHNGGSTVIIEFRNTEKVIYKLSSAGVTIAYNYFLRWVGNQLGTELKTFSVVDKGDYSWLEYVANDACTNPGDVSLYYERAGILAGLSYFLNSTDYHCENLIASGNCPVLVDHETIIGPEIGNLLPKSSIPEGLKQKRSKSVLNSSLLPNTNPNLPSYMCGFGSSIEQEMLLPQTKFKDVNRITMKKVKEDVLTELYKKNKPLLNDQIENLCEYEDEFKKGFRDLYQLIQREKDHLLSSNSPLNCFKGVSIRLINRPTRIYYKILKGLNKPEFLKDATIYGLKLEILTRAYSSKSNFLHIPSSERKQMLCGDIPAFYVKSTSNELMLSDGQNADIITMSAYEKILENVASASSCDYDDQTKIIEEVVSL
ncbi:MAG: type 2 lanthipeptide synthetase LanM, partial [Bacteroidota bacterium]